MQCPRDQLLAGSGFATDQHRRRASRQVKYLFAQRRHIRRLTQQNLVQPRQFRQPFPQAFVGFPHLMLIGGVGQNRKQSPRIVGFFNEAIGAALHRFDGHWDIAMGRNQNNRRAVGFRQACDQFKSGHPGHSNIRQNHMRQKLGQTFIDVICAGQGHSLPSCGLDQFDKGLTHFAVVIHYQNATVFHSSVPVGKETVNTVPPSGLSVAVMWPL